MHKTLALAAGLVLALAPGGAAFADTAPYGTGNGNAHGNCKHSSAGGTHAPLAGGAGKGNGGHQGNSDCDKPGGGVTFPPVYGPGDNVE